MTGGGRLAKLGTETASFAASGELKATQDFLDQVPEPHDRTVVLFGGTGAQAESVRAWLLARHTDTPLPISPLEAAAEPGATQLPNRAVAVVRCGLLLPEVVAGAAAVLARPSDTVRLVLTGADELRDEDDLAMIERGVWRLLLADAGGVWNGQSLAERGCLLWSTGELSAAVAERVTADMRQLSEWVGRPADAGEELAAVRLHTALDLAEHELGRRHAASAEAAGPQAPDTLYAQLTELRSILLSRLDADFAALEMALTASLLNTEQDLLAHLDGHLTRQAGSLSGTSLRQVVSDYLEEGGRRWRAGAVDLVDSRLRRSLDQAVELLDGTDWAAICAASRAGGGPSDYPDRILRRISPGAAPSVPAPDVLTRPMNEMAAGPTVLPLLRRAAFGGLGAAVSMIVLGPALIPAVAIGALGVGAATLTEMRIADVRDRRAALTYARAAVAATMGGFATAVRDQLRAVSGSVRDGVAAEFDAIDAVLGARTGPPAVQISAHPTTLAALRTELRTVEASTKESS